MTRAHPGAGAAWLSTTARSLRCTTSDYLPHLARAPGAHSVVRHPTGPRILRTRATLSAGSAPRLFNFVRAATMLGALRRAQLPLAWLCLLRLSHASRCASWCRWDLASSCFKHESCADCACPATSQEGCLAWCDGHCDDPKCATCRACKEHRACDPIDHRDAAIEGCASWCSTSFSSEHCGKCSCKACDFCLALYPREDEAPEVEDVDAPSSTPAAPIQMTDDLRRARERWMTAHQER